MSPEFLCAVDDVREPSAQSLHQTPVTSLFSGAHGSEVLHGSTSSFEDTQAEVSSHHATKSRVSRWVWVGAVAVLLVVAGVGWRHRAAGPQTPVDQFWAPVMRGPGTTLICSGGVVFEPRNFSGVQTAGKDIEYPFVSMQIAAAIGKVSGLLERGGATVQMQSCAPTPLTEMRERPVVLLGGYNNEWTLRLQSPLRYQFAPEVNASIIDREQPPGSLGSRPLAALFERRRLRPDGPVPQHDHGQHDCSSGRAWAQWHGGCGTVCDQPSLHGVAEAARLAAARWSIRTSRSS